MLFFCSIDLNTAESLCEQKWLPLDWLLSSNVVSKLDAIQLKSLNASFENSSHVNSLSLYKCVIQTLIRRFRQNKPFTLSPTKIGANLFNKPFGGFVTLLFDRRFICFPQKVFFCEKSRSLNRRNRRWTFFVSRDQMRFLIVSLLFLLLGL